jgi:hypothetical protein
MIPMTFHFAFFRGKTDFEWRDFHTLCVISCMKNACAYKIVIHYDRDGEGESWDAVRDLSGIEWRKINPPSHINGYPVNDQRLWCDVYRLDTLDKEGGFFCDLDFVFLKSFELLRHNEAVIGTQCSQREKLACGLMGSVPDGAFIRAYKEEYLKWTPDEELKWWNYANHVPWKLSKKYPVTILPRCDFYPLAWCNKTFWDNKPIHMKNSYAIHLWETLHPELCIPQLMDTCLGDTIEKIMEPKPIVTAREGVVVGFD